MTETKPHYNVVIATPGNNFKREYVNSLVSTLTVLNQENISFVFTGFGSADVMDAREQTAFGTDRNLNIESQEILGGRISYDKIFWIDSDMFWTPDHFLKIYKSDEDVTSGLYINAYGEPMFRASQYPPQELPSLLYRKRPFEVDGVGFGFVSFKQGVFESIQRPWFYREIVTEEINGKRYEIPTGEDYSFCNRVKEAGYEIYVDPRVKLGHVKEKVMAVPE